MLVTHVVAKLFIITPAERASKMLQHVSRHQVRHKARLTSNRPNRLLQVVRVSKVRLYHALIASSHTANIDEMETCSVSLSCAFGASIRNVQILRDVIGAVQDIANIG